MTMVKTVIGISRDGTCRNTRGCMTNSTVYYYVHIVYKCSLNTHNLKNLLFFLYVTSILLISCNDIELNPGPLRNLEISHLNIRSLRNKTDIVETELNKSDIICLTETHLTPEIPNTELIIPCYSENLYRLDRKTGPGGGVLIYHKNNIFTKRRHDLEHDEVEMIWVEIHIESHKFLLACLYRPESPVRYWEILDSVIEKAVNTNLDIVITGDININMLNLQPHSHLGRLITKFNLSNFITDPTRITPTSSTSIDIVFSNNRNIVKNASVLPPICSDHSLIQFNISYAVFKKQTYRKKILIYQDADYDQMNRCILEKDWENLINIHDTNEFNNILCDTIKHLINESIPTKYVTIRPNDKKWMTNDIRLHIRQRNRAHRKAKSSNSAFHWENYRKKRNETISRIRDAKKTNLLLFPH
ncbi:uncharacterized protein LOC110462782 [Mizuhopecten yessoensis]|uniref:uncharacterized protein LOC110448801 n=1 Tax=Mizuhopecten yessoensis TaxID=6573 RepID=UPI000B45E103|nr:uncharacterized protein LOC110448801 [Mizuhopecten yessoensis]XP_021358213.1 uncharacterized protein LOC110453560 [Mizuhopecten yessoensis]XP_021372622.1 uncharacterized protein LOC110462782 [Mizuhopecten yessoensis]